MVVLQRRQAIATAAKPKISRQRSVFIHLISFHFAQHFSDVNQHLDLAYDSIFEPLDCRDRRMLYKIEGGLELDSTVV